MRVNRAFSLLSSFVFASVATFEVTVNEYGEGSHPTGITVVLLAIILIHALIHLRMRVTREILLSIGFLSYELLSLSWTNNMKAAMITFPVLVNFTLVLILFSSLAAYDDVRMLLGGVFSGLLAGAALYTLTSGFPFTFPEDFSYNTIAGMYVFGLFITVIFGAYIRSTVLALSVGVVLMLLIAATTSIKSNLGVALGIIGAGVLYFKASAKDLVKGLVLLAILGSGLAYVVNSNPALTDRVQNGFARVSTGLAVLTNREDDSVGLGTRQEWKREGLRGWSANPVFGHGVEGFRSEFGITSHSTPVDLLYNWGLIGFSLFYGMLGSIAWRLHRARGARWRGVRARMAAFLITYSFMSLSGNLYYEPFLAIFVALSSVLLVRLGALAESGHDSASAADHRAYGPVAKT
jgi:O-Antigen ligase